MTTDLEGTLNQAHKDSAQAGSLMVYQIIKKRFNRAETLHAIQLLNRSLSALRSLIK